MNDVVLVLHSGMVLIGEHEVTDETVPGFKLTEPAQVVKTRVQVTQGIAVVESFEFFPVPHLHFPIDTPGGIVTSEAAKKYREARATIRGVIVQPGISPVRPLDIGRG
jgi:hypothetical protein